MKFYQIKTRGPSQRPPPLKTRGHALFNQNGSLKDVKKQNKTLRVHQFSILNIQDSRFWKEQTSKTSKNAHPSTLEFPQHLNLVIEPELNIKMEMYYSYGSFNL